MCRAPTSAAGGDEWITISIGNIEQWHSLCHLMEKPELIEDERFRDMAGLWANHNEVDRIIGEWTADKDNIELFHRLQKRRRHLRPRDARSPRLRRPPDEG